MKQLASYSFEATVGDDPSCIHASIVVQQVDKWLRSKGDLADDGKSLILHNGRAAEIDRSDITSSRGYLTEITLTEPTPDGWFHTNVKIAESLNVVSVAVSLSSTSLTLAPSFYPIHCPRLVRDLLAKPSPWRYRGTPLTSSPLDFEGERGGDDFIALAWDMDRSVPIVAVSDEYGSVLHPGIIEDLAKDLAGLAIVARLDPLASWRVTRLKQKEWSCYSGAIRIYWSPIGDSSSPFNHPLWTSQRLLLGVTTTEEAADRIRKQLRRRIIGQSTSAISDPPCFAEIRHAFREDEISELLAKASSLEEYKSLAELFSRDAEIAKSENQKLREENEELKGKNRELQYRLRWKSDSEEEVEPEDEVPPSTVDEAVTAAKEKFRDFLIFGKSVSDGIKTVDIDAGPPDKILRYLSGLAELTRIMQKGALGNTMIKWLGDRGIDASGESMTKSKSPKDQKNRTWDDGCGHSRFFNFHLKVTEATAPNRCVRIYYEYDEDRQKTLVGWVGRHPKE